MDYILRAVRDYLKKSDILLLLIALLASGLGMVLINSATWNMAGRTKLLLVQLLAIGLGAVCYVVASVFEMERFARWWPVLFLGNLFLQAMLIPFGVGAEETGNNSWIRFGGIGIQPGEIGKILFVLTFSRHAYLLRDRINNWKSVLQLTLHMLITVAAVYLCSNDLGVSIPYVALFAVLIIAAGLNWKWTSLFAFGGTGAVALLWTFFLKGYQKARFIVLWDPDFDPDKAYNGIQSMIALGNGGLLGKGYLQGSQTQNGYLPSRHTDFIFSVCGEEFGFVGCCVILLVLGLLIWRMYLDALKTNDRFGFLCCIGYASMILVQIIINVGMCCGIMPVIGLTLPFMSYGGTSVLTMFVCLGIVSGFVRQKKPDRILRQHRGEM